MKNPNKSRITILMDNATVLRFKSWCLLNNVTFSDVFETLAEDLIYDDKAASKWYESSVGTIVSYTEDLKKEAEKEAKKEKDLNKEKEIKEKNKKKPKEKKKKSKKKKK